MEHGKRPTDRQLNSLFVIDTEADGATPATGLMVSFAAVHVATGDSFYGHIYRHRPDEKIPAIPRVVRDDAGAPICEPQWDVQDGTVNRAGAGVRPESVAQAFEHWLRSFGSGRKILVSDNNAFDAMWLNCFLDQHLGRLPLGHSSRRIGDFYAGQQGKWADHSSWKRLRRTPHTHHPLDDARGNVEALRVILGVDPPR